MRLIDKNHLIADFMGAKFGIDPSLRLDIGECWLPIHGIYNYTTVELGKGKILEYHKSWDWLMPVIKKIEQLDASIFNYHVSNMTYFITQRHLLLKLPINTDILTVYNQIVDFIKWYNDAK